MKTKIILFIFFFFNVFSNYLLSQSITIFTIGDSTMADKPLENDNQERGWGQMLPLFFNDEIHVDNHAANGRSSKSFIDEGRWEEVASRIKKGDYVFIQFGHNDEKPDEARHTKPGTTFDANLRVFVEETRAKGGTPVLLNSIVRRKFNEDGILIDTHGDYLKSPENVAKELSVAFIDLNRLTHDLVQSLGKESSKSLYMWVGDRQDDTHLNINGGYQVAKLVIKSLTKKAPELLQYIQEDATKAL